ncbi:MAG: OmpH family outer membrane protein [Candidatus Wallbacteria bacterium]|nr:OmpH family outer membrane protein [Candidatus Wallbacteria bacterium]
MKVLLVLIALMFSITAFSAPAAAPAPFAIAYVDFQKIVQSYYKTEELSQALQGKAQERQKKFEASKKALDDMEKEYKAKESTLTTEQKQSQEVSLNNKMMELQEMGKKYDEEMQNLQSDEFNKLKAEIQTVMKTVADKEGFSVIVEKNVIYIGGTDLTDKVIETLNVGHKAPEKKPVNGK